MVYLIDEGSVFDAPIEKIWKYLPYENHRHPSFKNVGREVSGNVVIKSSERTFMGKSVKARSSILCIHRSDM